MRTFITFCKSLPNHCQLYNYSKWVIFWRFQFRHDERPVSKLKYNRSRNKLKILAKINHQKASCLKFDGGSMQVAFATFNHLMAFWCQWSSVKHDFWCGLRFSSSFENSSQQKWYPFFPEPLLLFWCAKTYILVIRSRYRKKFLHQKYVALRR